jgi:exodeoxyribonuclease VII small subunit
MEMTETSFKQAYGVLQQHAETLRNQQEPNIDDLLTIVTESVEAYKVCKERIDAVEKALEQALSGAGMSSAAGGGGVDTAAEASSAKHPAFDDGDIPF